MKVLIEIECNNAAFADKPEGPYGAPYGGDELARILHDTASRLRGAYLRELNDTSIWDANGNRVGDLQVFA